MFFLQQRSEVQAVRDALAAAGGLASQADLARRWSVSRQWVHHLTREAGFPEPAAVVSGRPVWCAVEADDFLQHRDLHRARAAAFRA